jgi:hypothetical protein
MTRAGRFSLAFVLAFGITAAWIAFGRSGARWAGVDEMVVERFARLAGRAPRPARFDTDHGDLLLFFFLVAGVVGGFVGGYCFRGLFPPGRRPES